MIELSTVFSTLYSDLSSVTTKLGFKPDIPADIEKGVTPVFTRDNASFISYSGEKGKIRILFNENKIRLLVADKNAKSDDDSDYTLLASFLVVLDEYNARDIKSIINEITENLEEAYSPKQIAKRQQNVKVQATVSRSAVKNGSLLYDPATLVVRLAAIYPELKDEYKASVEKYDEFLCEDFFVNSVNEKVYSTIKENNAQKMKKLFGILNEIFEDGTNEVQDLIVVTMLSSYRYDGEMYKTVLNYMNDSLVEPFVRVYSHLKSSRSSRMRLENPPKYKPKKKKKKSPYSSLLNQ